ncbi:AAA family ATPase [Desertihabitans aurantiacus]|uniref:AAA family ATPase n=1 Tax=Desertihabitans aurantiacus TaxID=2282477 RepID=UPI000DF82987|nr:AAA family ATPase [Desertihabitans aurantiacus]
MTTSTPPTNSPAARVLWFFGTDAVGKSTVAWEAYSALTGLGAHVAHLDTDYLSFCHPAPPEPASVVAANLSAVWSVYRSLGVDHLVISGIVVTPADRDRFCRAIPEAHFTFCRLTAAPATIRRRIFARRDAEAHTQGRRLSPSVHAELEEYSERSAGFAELLDRTALEDFTLATDDRSPVELATEGVTRFLSAAQPR